MMVRGTAEALTAATRPGGEQWALLGQPQRHDDRGVQLKVVDVGVRRAVGNDDMHGSSLTA